MGIFDKMKFWKKDDFSLDLGKPAEQPPAYDLDSQQFDPMHSPDPMQQGHFDSFSPEGATPSFPQNYPQSAPFPGSLASRQQQAPATQYPEQETVQQRDVELILAKLDAIKSELDALHQRVRKIEQVSDAQQSGAQRKYW